MIDPERRRAELVTALGEIRARITTACDQVGRDPRSVTLIAVTKTYPPADVASLVHLGVLDIGESKDQEARGKVAEVSVDAVRWHVVGRLQTNKAHSVAGYAHAVHSVDRPRLVRALGQACADRGEPLEVFVQVSLDGDPDRGGVPVAGVDELTDAVADQPGLRLRGLMAVPPLGADADDAFARLAELARQTRARHPGADALSAGMSSDFETAIRHGSTHVRVGTALLGRREPNIG